MINPRLKQQFIQSIGRKTYNKLCPEVKYMFLIDQLKKLNQDMVSKFGTQYNYLNWYARKQGFTNYYQYTKNWLHTLGYKNQYEYIKERTEILGYKNPYHYKVRKVREGLIRPYELINKSKRVKENSFSSFREYEDYLYRKKGFQNRAEFRRFRRFKKNFGNGYSDEKILEMVREQEMNRLYIEIKRLK